MGLEDKLADNWKKSVSIGIISVALANSLHSVYGSDKVDTSKPKTAYSQRESSQKPAKSDYTFEDFKQALGEKRLKNLKFGERELESYWSILDKREKKLICEVYKNPKEVYDSLSKEKKERFHIYYDFYLGILKPESVEVLNEVYESRFPWKVDIRNFGLSDKLWDFLGDYDAEKRALGPVKGIIEKEKEKEVEKTKKKPYSLGRDIEETTINLSRKGINFLRKIIPPKYIRRALEKKS